jgi:4-carboxymuconolactone decarboxylase
MSALEHQNIIFPLGEKTSSDYFTGTVFLNTLVAQDETGTYKIANVVFEPGSRTNWHTHATGQILLVTDGNGFYQEKGQAARSLKKGDTVIIPSNVVHWHGASNNSAFTHIAVTNNSKNGPVEWLQAVSEEEYSIVNGE